MKRCVSLIRDALDAFSIKWRALLWHRQMRFSKALILPALSSPESGKALHVPGKDRSVSSFRLAKRKLFEDEILKLAIAGPLVIQRYYFDPLRIPYNKNQKTLQTLLWAMERIYDNAYDAPGPEWHGVKVSNIINNPAQFLGRSLEMDCFCRLLIRFWENLPAERTNMFLKAVQNLENIQLKTLTQKGSGADPLEVRQICEDKGSATVLLLASAARDTPNAEEIEYLRALGRVLQVMVDDVADMEDDSKHSIKTPALAELPTPRIFLTYAIALCSGLVEKVDSLKIPCRRKRALVRRLARLFAYSVVSHSFAADRFQRRTFYTWGERHLPIDQSQFRKRYRDVRDLALAQFLRPLKNRRPSDACEPDDAKRGK